MEFCSSIYNLENRTFFSEAEIKWEEMQNIKERTQTTKTKKMGSKTILMEEF